VALFAAVGALLAAPAVPAQAQATAPGDAPPELRVGTSGDYAPFSVAGPEGTEGFAPTVAAAFAAELGREILWVPFRWPGLLDDLAAGEFEAAASGITVRPERSVAARTSVPLAETGAVALVHEASTWRRLDELDAPGVRIAVNQGGHLERVARARFPRASLRALTPNAAVRRALLEGRADAAITDTVEAPHWSRGARLRTLGPFTRDRKAWLVRADRPGLAAALDRFLLAREADGSLARWRARHGLPEGATAAPLPALLAALDERLSLMPLVAETKRARGLPVEVPEREARVLELTVRAVGRAAREAGVEPPPAEAVRAFTRAQMEAAKALQRSVPVAPGLFAGAVFDLDRDLRPALLRIGGKIARLAVVLPPHLECDATLEAARAAIRTPRVADADVAALAATLAGLRGARCPLALR
jgi:cyclohexadienyl dehydratase